LKSAEILIVDDQPDNLLVLEDLLEDQYNVHSASDGRGALDYLEAGHHIDLILLDVMMPGLDGYAVCQRIKAAPRTRDIPVIFLTSLGGAEDEERGLSLGAEDFVHKPISPPVVLARVSNHLKLSRATSQLRERNDDLERLVEARTAEILRKSEELTRREQELNEAQAATISAFCSLAEVRDSEIGNHIRRTQHYVRALAEKMQQHPRFREALRDNTIELLFKSAPLHDVGKVAIPDAILLKQGKLNEDEWKIMKLHTVYGRDAIISAEMELGTGQDSFLRHAREIAYGHHERWNGSGYPEGLVGEAIPVSARLMAVADVYDAFISRRVYKSPLTHEQALDLMTPERGRHFDPDILDGLLAIEKGFQQISQQFGDDDD
jgi:putative two-component system response regulator